MIDTSTPPNHSAWIETFTGKRFELLDPKPEQICIEDIAHALAMSVRFCGHVQKFYSVAEHSVHVSNVCDPENALWGLLHDASEAYIADLSRPLKHCTPIGPPYIELEEKIMTAIATKFDLPTKMPSNVKWADSVLLFAEKEKLMAGVPWGNKWDHDGTRFYGTLWCLDPIHAEQEFLLRFQRLRRTTLSAAGTISA
jgi:5'-deoxynucleotidase YfbR-like HD superfamily hydrolase